MEESMDENVTIMQKPLWRCRWWLATRPVHDADMPVVEFYVPWWAWPLELCHRAIFGVDRIRNP